MINLNRSASSCNNPNDLSNKVCVSNETEDLNLNVFNIITEIKESRTLTKRLSRKVNVNLMVDNLT